MSEYSKFTEGQELEYLCPACGVELKDEYRVEAGWNCPSCGDFIPKDMAINPYKGVSNEHSKTIRWR